MTALRYWGSLLRRGLNPMDPRFRGDDGVFFRYRQIIRHSRVGKLFVIPGRRSRTRNPWGSSIREALIKSVIPAKAGIHLDLKRGFIESKWIPAFAGMTAVRYMGFVD